MNKRIRELAEQADAVHIQGKLKDRALVGYDNIEKFAELIVQECKDIAFRHGDNVDYLSLQVINNEVDDAQPLKETQ